MVSTTTTLGEYHKYSENIIKIQRTTEINIDQLDVTRFIISPFTAQHVSNVSTSIFHVSLFNYQDDARSNKLIIDIFIS